MDYDRLSDYVLSLLQTELDPRLYYHSIEHTLGVISDCEKLSNQYDLTEEQILILKTAALMHDMGFLVVYHNHEAEGSKMAKTILPDYGYSEKQIKQIQRLIEVTKIPEKPQNNLECIILDADLYYLGTSSFNRISSNLFKEWSVFSLVDDINEFLQKQINFLEWHEYHTPLAQETLNVKKQKNLLIVKEELKRFTNKLEISSTKRVPFVTWKANQLLKDLTEEQFGFLEKSIVKKQYKVGDVVVKEGTQGNNFFLIEQGKVDIRKQGVLLATCEAGDSFGTMILIEDVKRSATVTVTENAQLVILKKSDIVSTSNNKVEESIFFKIIKNQLISQQASLRSTNELGVLQTKTKESEQLKRLQFGTFISYIVDSISNFIILIDNDKKIMDTNKSWERIAGYDKNQLIGKHLFTYIEGVEELIKNSKNLHNEFIETTIIHKNTGKIPVQLNATPVFEGELLNGYIISGTDLTTEYKTKEQLENTVFDLEEKNILLRHFTYILSHDLKEPIRTIKSFSEILQRRYEALIDDTGIEILNFINDGSNRLTLMIDGLLQYSRLDSKNLTKANTSLAKIIENIKLDISLLIKEKNTTLIVKKNCQLFVDKTLINQVFQNLIINAIKYSKKETPPVIEISAKVKKNSVLISVKDNGKGIVEDRLEEIFQLFQRGPEKNEIEGTGIGLGICHKIVAMHKGKIWVESEMGVGSTFFVKLPIK